VWEAGVRAGPAEQAYGTGPDPSTDPRRVCGHRGTDGIRPTAGGPRLRHTYGVRAGIDTENGENVSVGGAAGLGERGAGGIPGARERLIRSGGIELCLAELGDPARPTVVLVHGYPDTKEVWSEVAVRLRDHGFHVVLYDVRGHGGSSAPRPLRGGFTLEKLTGDFLAVADAVSPDRPVHLVGHDWGSVQGWEFVTVARTRGRIASFTSMSGPSLDHFGHWIARRLRRPTPRRVAQLIDQGAKSWYICAFHTPLLPELAWRGPLGRRWPGLLRRLEGLSGDSYPTASLPRDAANGVWLYRDNVRTRLGRPRPDAHAHTPVQLITPTGDGFLSPRLHDELEQWVPRLTRRSLPARHWAPRSRPELLAAWIAGFATAHEDGAADGAATGKAVRRAPDADRFGGRLVLVTGAASGIGRATALAFAAAGARVVAVDLDGEGAEETAGRCRKAGAPAAWAETVDVGDEQAMEAMAEKVAREYGVVDILVNNAGVGLAGPLLSTGSDDWRRMLDVNLWGVIHGCRIFGKQMAERGQGGHIVNIASAAAFLPSRLLPAYSTAKAAVLMLSQCLRAELAGARIGVTAICPGIVDTGITRTTRFAGAGAAEEERRRKRSARLYGMRGYPPEKVAEAVLRAVSRNRAVVPVTPEARVVHALSRLAPRVLRGLGRLDPGT
jgi:NAD(P)-dependent dehydrogenase (short-subunit alcohol dehydrogenase family)/pimeloyl-ACP methyl ester carboxylesterase